MRLVIKLLAIAAVITAAKLLYDRSRRTRVDHEGMPQDVNDNDGTDVALGNAVASIEDVIIVDEDDPTSDVVVVVTTTEEPSSRSR